jgi:nitrogen regulatory protein PII 2
MKEIMAIIRMNKMNETRDALAKAGFPAFFCCPCLGRGKNNLTTEAMRYLASEGELPADRTGEAIAESFRFIPKRFFTMIVEDEQTERVLEVIMKVNGTGTHGDGRVFVLPVAETYVVRTGESTL